MLDSALLNSIDDLIGNAKNGTVAKAGGYLVATVDAGELLSLSISAKLLSLLDNSAEVLLAVSVLVNVNELWEGNKLGSVDAVLVARTRWHEAVSGEDNRCWNVLELLLLVLPCSTKVALELWILLELWITVSWEHLAVGVNVNAGALGLLKNHLEVKKVVTRNNDEWTWLNSQRNLSRNWGAISAGICAVEKSHALEVDLAYLKGKRQQNVNGGLGSKSSKSLYKESVNCVVGLAKNASVVSVSSHTADTKENEGLEGPNVLVVGPNAAKRKILNRLYPSLCS